jgi:8-oxo-dGTP pyrophosphatase MutT (NUDIX family)
MSEPSIVQVSRLDVRCVERGWAWAEANAERIDVFWAEARARQPKLFDGPVFVLAEPLIAGGTFRAVCFETRFSRLLYAKTMRFPDPAVINGFAQAALQASDGAFLLGVMGPDTANSGQIYFPAGTPDPSDRQDDGALDLLGSVVRELAEETGLQPDDYELGEGWTVVRDGGRLAFLRPVRLPEPAGQARARMLARMERLEEQELSDIYVAYGLGDIDERRMPPFIQAYLRWSFGSAINGSRSAASSP